MYFLIKLKMIWWKFIADMPNLCPDRDEFNPPVKIYHHKKHFVIYIVETGFIQIVRVLHGRMDTLQHMEK